jgi:hypothetical protein
MLDLGRTVRLGAAAALLVFAACTQTDEYLTQRVETQIRVEVPSEQVKVSTERRIVRLEGVVNDNAELNRVDATVRRVPGVLAVDNRLVVKPPVDVTGADRPSP